MSNYILLKSSYIGACIHLFFFVLYYSDSKHTATLLYSWGLLTSLLNHATTNLFYMYLDRFTMYICFIYNFILFLKTKNYIAFYLMLAASMLYFLQKIHIKKSKSYLHCLAHIIIAVCNVILYINY